MPRGKFNEWVEEAPRRKPVTEEDLVTRNVYQGPPKRPVSPNVIAVLFGLFWLGVVMLAWCLR
jgi:hypothetical protein